MSCKSFSDTSPACRTITLIEPDSTLLSSTSSGSVDLSLDESGSLALPVGRVNAPIEFTVLKASDDYRFEYLYVEATGITNPGTIVPVVDYKIAGGFLVHFAGAPQREGYILRWRVVVNSLTVGVNVNAAENLRVQIPTGFTIMVVNFVNPRSSTTYGFSELRVENLTDLPSQQRFIHPQVVGKAKQNFTVELSAPVNSHNYYLCVRTP